MMMPQAPAPAGHPLADTVAQYVWLLPVLPLPRAISLCPRELRVRLHRGRMVAKSYLSETKTVNGE